MKTIEELEKELLAAQRAEYKIKEERDRWIHKETQEAIKIIQENASDQFGAQFKAAVDLREATQIALDAARQMRAEAGAGALLPIGTKYHKWDSGGWGSSIRWKRTGEVGIIELFKRGDQWPLNRSCGCPNIGETVLRILKKDGSRGIKAEKLSISYGETLPSPPWGWYKEGVDPSKFKV